MKPRILYFDIRGRAEPLRLLLEDVGVEFTDHQVTLEQWPEIRDSTPFGRMPVYSEGELEIPESFAIMHYLGRKHGLLGADEAARVRCDVTIEAWRDYSNRVANTFGALSTSQSAREAFVETEQPALLADLEAFYLANPSGAPFWAGDSPTIADYAAFHLIEGVAGRFPELFTRLVGLQKFYEQFSQRPRIRAYLASSRRPTALFYGPNGKIYPHEPPKVD